MKSEDWTTRRAAQRMKGYERNAKETTSALQRAYDIAARNLERYINGLLDRYQYRYGLDEEEARAILRDEIDNEKWAEYRKAAKEGGLKSWEAERRLKARLNAASYRYRISVAEAIRNSADLVCVQLADITIRQTERLLQKTALAADARTEYDVQRAVGVGWRSTGISKDRIEEIIHTDWSGIPFSERIWRNHGMLAQALEEEMIANMLGGRSREAVAEGIALRMNVGKYEAARLVHTEMAHVANAAELDRYRRDGIKEYVYIAVLDSKTSKICQGLNGKIFAVNEAEIGRNYPPMHPWCRSTTGAVLSREWARTVTRMAVNPLTGKAEAIPITMSFAEWKRRYMGTTPIKQ
jgi:SPP1 gp7 family putative phage head morphogenesis protein